jgi:hypothetical protein
MKICSVVDLLLRDPGVRKLRWDLVILRHEMHLRLLRCLGAEGHLYRRGGLCVLMGMEAVDHSTSPKATNILNRYLVEG